MQNKEVEKGKVLSLVEMIEYVPNAILIKTVLNKTTGNISVASFDAGETMKEKKSPFDTFIQIIDGVAEIAIDGESNTLISGQSIIIPAHYANSIIANVRFKMINTIIKSGYDQVSIG